MAKSAHPGCVALCGLPRQESRARRFERTACASAFALACLPHCRDRSTLWVYCHRLGPSWVCHYHFQTECSLHHPVSKAVSGRGPNPRALVGSHRDDGWWSAGGCLRTPTLIKNRKDGTRQIFSPRVSFHLMKEYSSLWYFRHSKAFPRFQTKRYASGNDLFLFSVFCRIPEKTGNTGAEKLRGRTHPMTHDVYLLYRLFKDSSTKSYGEEKPNRYSTNNSQWAILLCAMVSVRLFCMIASL